MAPTRSSRQFFCRIHNGLIDCKPSKVLNALCNSKLGSSLGMDLQFTGQLQSCHRDDQSNGNCTKEELHHDPREICMKSTPRNNDLRTISMLNGAITDDRWKTISKHGSSLGAAGQQPDSYKNTPCLDIRLPKFVPSLDFGSLLHRLSYQVFDCSNLNSGNSHHRPGEVKGDHSFNVLSTCREICPSAGVAQQSHDRMTIPKTENSAIGKDVVRPNTPEHADATLFNREVGWSDADVNGGWTFFQLSNELSVE